MPETNEVTRWGNEVTEVTKQQNKKSKVFFYKVTEVTRQQVSCMCTAAHSPKKNS